MARRDPARPCGQQFIGGDGGVGPPGRHGYGPRSRFSPSPCGRGVGGGVRIAKDSGSTHPSPNPLPQGEGEDLMIPGSLAPTAPIAARNAASASNSVVSSKTASSAGRSGAAVRAASCASRARMSCSTSLRSAGTPLACSSCQRRRARSSRLAVTNSFTPASGKITVPMSRPSSTAPGSAAKLRWKPAAPRARRESRPRRRRRRPRAGCAGHRARGRRAAAPARRPRPPLGRPGRPLRPARGGPPRDTAGRYPGRAGPAPRRSAVPGCPCLPPRGRRSR